VVESLQQRLGHLTKVVDRGEPVRMRDLAEDLHARGIRRLMFGAGGAVHTQFLADDLVDELQLVVAPFFVGEPGARRFVGEAHFPWHPGHRARLAATEQIGDVVLLRYALSDRYDPADDELPAD